MSKKIKEININFNLNRCTTLHSDESRHPFLHSSFIRKDLPFIPIAFLNTINLHKTTGLWNALNTTFYNNKTGSSYTDRVYPTNMESFKDLIKKYKELEVFDNKTGIIDNLITNCKAGRNLSVKFKDFKNTTNRQIYTLIQVMDIFREYVKNDELGLFHKNNIYANWLSTSRVTSFCNDSIFNNQELSKLQGIRTSTPLVSGALSLFTYHEYTPIFLGVIEKEDLEYYKLCMLLEKPFPINKIKILVDTVKFKQYINTRSTFGTCINRILKNAVDEGFKVEYTTGLYEEIFITKSLPKLKSIIDLKNFSKVISTAYSTHIKTKNPFTIDERFKPISNEAPSKRIVSIYKDFENNKKVKTMVTHNLEKSKLATLVGLGQTPEQIAAKIGVEANDVRDALIQLGLVRSRKKPKPYIINLVEDI